MFLGNFIQFQHATNIPLYIPNSKLDFSYTKKTQEQVINESILKNYVMSKKIILIGQMSQ